MLRNQSYFWRKFTIGTIDRSFKTHRRMPLKLRITESSAAFKRALDKDVFLNLL